MTKIILGSPITAPQGYDVFEKDQTYYFLRSDPIRAIVYLVHFYQRNSVVQKCKSGPRKYKSIVPPVLSRLMKVRREYFEQGITGGFLVAGECQSLPPWLNGLNEDQLIANESTDQNCKIPHSDRIDKKISHIYPLVRDLGGLLEQDDPDKYINHHARHICKPAQNETRLRQWVYAYLICGMNRFALHYPIHRIGHWDRDANSSDVKRGRPHRRGRGYGNNTSKEVREKIVKAYRAECGLGIKMSTIYSESMINHFGCKVRVSSEGGRKLKEFFHPEGRPFPTIKTFVYYSIKELGRRQIQKNMFGKVIARTKHDVSRGNFGEHVWNLMQRVEHDGYSVKDLPKGYIEGSTLPALKVIRSRDTLSGMITGIGFSSGGERASAYRMAKFCEAVDKVRFCALFGIDISPAQWPSVGLSPYDIQDRGPGATPGAISRDEISLPVIIELPPSHSGQGKALVETSNPKSFHDREAPKYIKSDHTTIELARREIFEVLAFNEITNVGDHIPPDISRKVSLPNPNGLWEAFSGLGRINALQIRFDSAVRQFLDKTEGRLDREGVHLLGRNYFSSVLVDVGAMDRLTGGQGMPVTVYFLEACVRHIWVEIRGRLIELDVRYPIPVGASVLYMSAAEAVEYTKSVKQQDLDQADHALAVSAEYKQKYLEATGKKWNAGRVVAGRPKRGTSTARQEAAEARSVGNRRKK